MQTLLCHSQPAWCFKHSWAESPSHPSQPQETTTWHKKPSMWISICSTSILFTSFQAILSSSELGETSPGRSAVTQCIEASSSGSSGISAPSTLALPTPVAMAIFWSYTLNDFGCWACKCCNVSSDTSFISTTVSRCWSASSSAGSCGHVPQICLKRPS